MGATRDDFVKYPRTPHLFGSRGTDDDKHLSAKESMRFVDDDSLIVEEKLDGTNTGIHFHSQGRMILQCRGHEIKTGMHPQYDLFKQWTMGKRPVLEAMLADRFILFGEWLYAKHSVHYRSRITSSSSTFTINRWAVSSIWIRACKCSMAAALRPYPCCTAAVRTRKIFSV